MSNVLGIIAEYNPFHNGHLYHLNESKKITKTDYTVAIVGGNFTQRGSTSIVNKWDKAKMALQNGIDLVIELPLLYSISSAENFADGSIKILNSLGIINNLSFGAETNDINTLNKIADILYDEPEDFKLLLSKELDTGISFPKARENAIIKYLKNKDNDDISNIISSPNNILAIEYLKALKKHNSNIKPSIITRSSSDYNSTDYSDNIASATAIRELLKNESIDEIKKLVPSNTYKILKENYDNKNIILDLNIFEKEILYNLRKMSTEELFDIQDVSDGLEFSLKKAASNSNNLDILIEQVKSKRYTFTRIQRILLHILLGITKKDIEISKTTLPYIRILGFNKNGQKLLSEIKIKNPNIQIITSVKKFIDENKEKNLSLLIEKDILATNIYTLGYKTNSESNLDYTNPIIKI